MPDKLRANDQPTRFSLREMFIATAVAAVVAASWYYFGSFAVVGLPLWISLIAAAVSRQRGSAFASVFVNWFIFTSIILILFLVFQLIL